MFNIEKSKDGMTDYLLSCEQDYTKSSLIFSQEEQKKFLSWTKKNNIDIKNFDKNVYANYLEQSNNHIKAKFSGSLADKFKLEFSKEDFTKLMNAEVPNSILKQEKSNLLKKKNTFINDSKNKVNSYSIVSSFDKSVSIEYVSNEKSRRKIERAFEKTDKEMNKLIAKKIKPSNKKQQYQDFDNSKTEILTAEFCHYEARGYEPHLHKHKELMNFAKFYFYTYDEQGFKKVDKNGNYIYVEKYLAVDCEEIFKRQVEFSQIQDNIFYSNLREEGFKIERTDNNSLSSQKLVGYDDKKLELLSSRKNQIEDELSKVDSDYNKQSLKEQIRKQTATDKESGNCDDILTKINDKISTVINKEEMKAIRLKQSEAFQEFDELNLDNIVERCNFDTNGMIDETKLKTIILNEVKHSFNSTSIEELDKKTNEVIKQLESRTDLNKVVKLANNRYSTLDVIVTERKVLNNTKRLNQSQKSLDENELKERRKFIADFIRNYKRDKGFNLNRGQIESIKKAILNESKLNITIGDAGTGKTTSVELAINKFYESRNIKTIGISTSEKATQAIKDAEVKELLNSTNFLNQAFDKNGEINTKFLEQNKNSVLLLDEASMLSSKHYEKITEFALKSNSKIYLVGDDKQLKSVGFGNSFNDILKQTKEMNSNSIARLDETVRQKNKLAKDIALLYRDKKIDEALNLLESNNLLVKEKSTHKLAEKIVEDYLKDSNKSKVVICYYNDEIDYINDKIRTNFIEQEKQKLKNDSSYKSNIDFKNQFKIEVSRKDKRKEITRERSFCVGENIVFTENFTPDKNNRNIKINNADIGKILDIKKNKNNSFTIKVQIEDKTITFNSKQFNKFNHSFAISTYKSQGQSIDNVYVLANSNTNSNQEYVNFSRHKKQVKLYIEDDKIEQYKNNAKKEQVKLSTIDDLKAERIFQAELRRKVNEIEQPVELKSQKDEFSYLNQDKNKIVFEREKQAKQAQIKNEEVKKAVKVEIKKDAESLARDIEKQLANMRKSQSKSKGLSL